MAAIPYRSPCNGRVVPCAITLWKLNPFTHAAIYILWAWPYMTRCVRQHRALLLLKQSFRKMERRFRELAAARNWIRPCPKTAFSSFFLSLSWTLHAAELRSCVCAASQLSESLVPKFLQQGLEERPCSLFVRQNGFTSLENWRLSCWQKTYYHHSKLL